MKKIAPVIILGGIIGGFAGYTGQDYGMVADAAWTGYAAIIVENVLKWGWRKAARFGLNTQKK